MNNAIAWYRPNPIPKLMLTGFISGALMITGVVIMAFGIDQSGRINAEWKSPSIIIGISIVITGVVRACFRIYKILEDDTTTLVLGLDGIEYNSEHDNISLSWNQVKSITYSNDALILQTKEGEVLIRDRFLGISGTDLANKIKEVQHSILLGVPIRD